MDAGRWNHNIHYHPVILNAVPDGAARVLDVGCGEGMLTRQLGAYAQSVKGIDLDAPSIDLARKNTSVTNVDYVLGDFLTHDFELASFDAVASVATLHHVDLVQGLTRMAALLRPGGVLAVVGIARSRPVVDLPFDVAGAIATRLYQLRKPLWNHTAPICWPPPETFAGVKRIAQHVLPGAGFRRHMLWRYSLVWTKPSVGF